MHRLSPNRQPRDLSDTVQWLNSSGEAVPAYGVVKLFAYDELTNQFQADKPDGKAGIHYVNGGVSIPGDGYSGSLLWNLPRRCLMDSADYNVGDSVGPLEDQWSMGADGSGWRVLRPPNIDNVAVVQKEGGAGPAIFGIIYASRGCGYYDVEVATWAGSTPDGGCDGCASITAAGPGVTDEECGTAELPGFPTQLEGTGEFVLAYDPQSVLVPLQLGSDCTMMDMGAENDAPGGGKEIVYQIKRGFQVHTVQYKNRYECCNGVDLLVGRTAIIFAGIECEETICNECPAPPG